MAKRLFLRDVGGVAACVAWRDRVGSGTGLGLKFGSLTVEGFGSGRKVVCRCDCGQQHEPTVYNLLKGRSTRCRACEYAALPGNPRWRTHGDGSVNKGRSYLYVAWLSMKQRCENASVACYGDYGGRGIAVCAEWRNAYPAFKQWVLDTLGERPDRTYSLDRIDNDGNYEPGNVRWATKREQRANQRPRRQSQKGLLTRPFTPSGPIEGD